MKYVFLFITALLSSTTAVAQPRQGDILLLGTFHFHNPGADLVKVKTFDVMTPKVQAELEAITDKINRFHPDKIFVEWPWNNQKGLDELYKAYLAGNYEQYVNTTFTKPGIRNLHLRGETVQLAFRAGKKPDWPGFMPSTTPTFPFLSTA